jgi:hypothetical protein
VTFWPNFTTHDGWTNCHRELAQLSQVTISTPSPRGGWKIRELNDTGTKKMWVEKFKSPIVTRTNHVGQSVTRTKCGWTKCQGTPKHALFTFARCMYAVLTHAMRIYAISISTYSVCMCAICMYGTL